MFRESSIDASYQVSVHLAKGFQGRRLKCEKLTDDGRQSSHCLNYSHSDLFQSCVMCIVILILATDTRGELGSQKKSGTYMSVPSRKCQQYLLISIQGSVLHVWCGCPVCSRP
jgi:hypothetical protein